MKYLPFLISFLWSWSAIANHLSVQLLDVNGKPIEGVVVYATPEFENSDPPSKSKPLIIDQKNKKFAPYLTVMQKGQDIQFDNLDDITHHIYSASGNNQFEFKLQAGTNKVINEINSTGEIAMGCNIHDWMSGFVLVVDTPYFDKTNLQGKVTLAFNRSGRYKVTVWHPQLLIEGNRVSQLVEVKSDNDQQLVKITLPKALAPIPSQANEEEFDFLEEY